MATEAYLAKCDIRSLNRIFRLAIRQVILLNESIVHMKKRYQRACAVNRRSFRYTTRLNLAALEGTRNVYYEYASIKCDEIENLQEQLRELTGEEYDFADEELNFIGEDGESDEDDDDDEEEEEEEEDEEMEEDKDDESMEDEPMTC